MLQNYLAIAWRNLLKNKAFSAINIFGLATGLACCLIILLYVTHELSYDRWNPNAERILRPVADINFGGNHYQLAVVGSIVGPDATRELPEIQAYCRFRDHGSYLVRRDGSTQPNIREERVLSTDSSFFEVFPLRVLEGSPGRCLTQPDRVALSKTCAEKYFGTVQMALGQTLLLENTERRQVSAVFEDMPENSHFQADMLLPLNGDEEVKTDPTLWGTNNNFNTYLLLRPGTNVDAFQQKFQSLAANRLEYTARQALGTTTAEMAKSGQYARYDLQRLSDIHLHSDLLAELGPNGSIRYVWLFGAIGFFVLLIACINFMNLSTARSATRAREVGVRKALGGQRSALVGQFLSESMLVTALAVVLALGVAALALPAFNDLADRELSIPWTNPLFWAGLAGGVGIVGLLAGSYPAFFLSAFEAVRVLKGEATGSRKGGGLRSALVVFQFAVSVSLIIATVLVFNQLRFIQTKKLGYEKDQVLILDDAYVLGPKAAILKQEMLRLPAVESATISSYLPVPSSRNDQTFSTSRAMDPNHSVGMQHWRVDADYLKTLGMTLVQGRNFDPARTSDSSTLILNETAAKLFGFADPVGQKVYLAGKLSGGAPKPEDFEELTIIGVVKDFHWASLRDRIGPLCLHFDASSGLMAFRLKGSDAPEVIAALNKQWQTLAPAQPFSHRFLDEAFTRIYRAERRVGKVAALFAILSVFVSCLGLFGLASFMVEQRRKEIGIRKVLGASVFGITGLLARDFLKLVVLGILLATPLAWYAMSRWLDNFAYRVTLSWWVFALAGVGAVGIAFLTVGFQSVKAALTNPVRSLRSE